jgi:peptidoglycan/LPS O-acetylase OafA/YrhL
MCVVYLGLGWSISAEAMLYLLYLPIAWTIAGLGSRQAVRSASACLIICATIIYGGRAFGLWLTEGEQHWLFYWSPYCRFAEFLLGGLAAAHYRCAAREEPDAPATVGGVVFGAGSLLYLVLLYALGSDMRSGFFTFQQSWGYAPGAAGLIYFFARYRTRASCLVENWWVLRLGDTSYSQYLLHGYALGLVRRLVPDPDSVWLLTLRTAGALAFVLLIAMLSYRYFEVPARRMVRTALDYRLPATATG